MDTDLKAPPSIPLLKELTEDELTEIEVEITPGVRRRVKVPKGRPPRFLVQRLVKNGRTGEYFCVPTQPYGPCVRLVSRLPSALGLPIGVMTLKRLIYSGFIRAYRLAPQITLIDIASLWEHLAATEVSPNKPLFWTQEKHLRYAEWRAYGSEENDPADQEDPEDD